MKTETTTIRTSKTPFTRQSRRVFFCMKTFFLLLAGLTAFATASFAQVAVTNPGNTTPRLAATYTSLAHAITDLNASNSHFRAGHHYPHG